MGAERNYVVALTRRKNSADFPDGGKSQRLKALIGIQTREKCNFKFR